MDEYKIDYVRLESGHVPFIRFLDSLEKRERAEVLATIEVLREKRTQEERIPPAISKHLWNGIFELRVRHYNRITRSLNFFHRENK